MPEKFPIQGGPNVPWWAAEQAYRGYAKCYPGSASQQSLAQLGERGGFGVAEFACLFNGHGPSKRAPHMSGRGEDEERARCVAKAFLEIGQWRPDA